MKAMLLHTVIFIFSSFSFLTGCDYYPVTSQIENPSDTKGQSAIPDTGLVNHSYDGAFKINPGETLYLNYGNCQLVQIEKYSVSNCNIDRRDFIIRASNMPLIKSLPCDWESGPGLMAEDLSIKNVSNVIKKVIIKMEGYTLDF